MYLSSAWHSAGLLTLQHMGYHSVMMPQQYPQMENAAQMMQSLSLVRPGEQSRYIQSGMPGGINVPSAYQGVPYGFVPSPISVPQAIRHPGMQVCYHIHDLALRHSLQNEYIPSRATYWEVWGLTILSQTLQTPGSDIWRNNLTLLIDTGKGEAILRSCTTIA